jgi:hypothetical protein
MVGRASMSILRSWWLLSAVVGVGIVSSGCASGQSGGQTIRPGSLVPPGTCYVVTSAAEYRNLGSTRVPVAMCHERMGQVLAQL